MTVKILGGRRWKQRCRRRCGASVGPWFGGEEGGVEGELLGASARLGVAGGHGEARRRRRVCSVAARERARGGEELGERVRGLGGCVASRTGSRATRGSRRWLGGKQEVAEAASASATPRLCSSSWQRRKRTKEEEVGWAGWGNWAGSGGCAGKARYACSFYFFLFCLFYLISFAIVFKFKIISYSAKTF